MLVKVGEALARDAQARLEFPGGLTVFADLPESIRKPLRPPLPPEKPEAWNLMQGVACHNANGGGVPSRTDLTASEADSTCRRVLHDAGKTRVHTEMPWLQPGIEVSIANDIHIHFASVGAVAEVPIRYSILAAGLSEPINGVLKVRVAVELSQEQ
ncbi:MAG: hypothetical protein ACI9F9_002123 [Candidatus Paceibacteria bacterium]|jgi:hypothetical protein